VPLRDKIVDILGKTLSTRLMNNTKIGVTPIFHLSGLASPSLRPPLSSPQIQGMDPPPGPLFDSTEGKNEGAFVR
jgi:hypothetical protein